MGDILADYVARREAEADSAAALSAVRKDASEAAAAFGAKMRAKLAKLEIPLADRREEDERQVCRVRARARVRARVKVRVRVWVWVSVRQYRYGRLVAVIHALGDEVRRERVHARLRLEQLVRRVPRAVHADVDLVLELRHARHVVQPAPCAIDLVPEAHHQPPARLEVAELLVDVIALVPFADRIGHRFGAPRVGGIPPVSGVAVDDEHVDRRVVVVHVPAQRLVAVRVRVRPHL